MGNTWMDLWASGKHLKTSSGNLRQYQAQSKSCFELVCIYTSVVGHLGLSLSLLVSSVLYYQSELQSHS